MQLINLYFCRTETDNLKHTVRGKVSSKKLAVDVIYLFNILLSHPDGKVRNIS
jgi:hypothetical protein